MKGGQIMSKVTAFGYSNTADSANTVTLKALGVVSNYALTRDVADVVTLSNKTAPIDQEEIIEFRSRTNGDVKTSLNIQHPAKVTNAVEYSVRNDAVLTTTESTDPDFRVDEPIVCTIAIKHPRSGNITEQLVLQHVLRTVSSLFKADGTTRIGDLMRSAERPVAD
jgi:hypothetical protein